MYSLTSENLANLGQQGATTHLNWKKYFSSLEKAKAYAEKDYGKPIEWVNTYDGTRSPDLLWVTYHISKVEVEE